MSDLNALATAAVDSPVASLSISELHGAVIGIAVGGPSFFDLQSLIDLLGVEALSDQSSVEAFVNAALLEIGDGDFSFQALLPDDDVALEQRLVALAEWTSSFLAGLALGLELQGSTDFEGMTEQAREIVDDFAAIADVDVSVSGEEAEQDFLQLEEFVKVGALLLMSLLRDVDQNPEE